MDIKLNVKAGPHHRSDCAVSTVLKAEGISALTRAGVAVPFQARALDGAQCELLFIVDDLAANMSADYLATVGPSPTGGGLELADTGSSMEIRRGGTVLTAYHYLDPKAARPFWFPVLGPAGQRLTRAYPMENIEGEKHDHPHHRSLWVAYGDVNGTDNWSQEEHCGTQAHQAWLQQSSGPVCVTLEEAVVWRSHEGTAVLDERRLWRFFDRPSGAVWDLEVDLTPAAGVPQAVFGDTKEGGLCSVRVATSMDVPQGVILNSVGGINEDECWGQRAHWCDYSGPVDGEWAGLTIFDHPTSFRHPTWWHVRNYGLMTANCFGLSHFTNGRENGDYTLPAGEILRFRYRLLAHAQAGEAVALNAAYQDYAHPPKVTVA